MTVWPEEGFTSGRVHVRTPTYRRPALLERCLRSLQAQTWADWICEVFDDDPDQTGRAVCERLADRRIVYRPNRPQRFASKNIDGCFSALNPYDAEYFFVLEDDNYVFDGFIAENIALARREGVELVLRNQVVDYDLTGAGRAMSEFGILEGTYREGRQSAETIRLGALAGIGVSNGALFWSARARSRLEIVTPCNASLQEYLRTLSVVDDVYVALEPLAAWAANGEQTTRNLGDRAGYLKRELDLKRAIQRIRRRIWQTTEAAGRRAFLDGQALSVPADTVAEQLARALIFARTPGARDPATRVGALLRGLAIAVLGRTDEDVASFIDAQPRPRD